jgi:hypothetical protein
MNDLQDAGEQLAFAEALEADLNARRAELARNPNLRPSGQMCEACRSGMGQCQGGNCPGGGSGKMRSLAMNSGQWRPGETLNRRGNGTGGPGQGRGGNPPESENVNPTFRDEQLLSQHSAGEIIAEFKFKDGQQIAGESNVALSDALLGYEQEAERTLETEVIPAGYRNITREYFSTFTGSGRADDHDHELEAGDATTAP